MLSPTKLLAVTATAALLSHAAVAGPMDHDTDVSPQEENLVEGMPLWGPFTPDFPLSLLIENWDSSRPAPATMV